MVPSCRRLEAKPGMSSRARTGPAHPGEVHWAASSGPHDYYGPRARTLAKATVYSEETINDLPPLDGGRRPRVADGSAVGTQEHSLSQDVNPVGCGKLNDRLNESSQVGCDRRLGFKELPVVVNPALWG
jgi:hypothetical protein